MRRGSERINHMNMFKTFVAIVFMSGAVLFILPEPVRAGMQLLHKVPRTPMAPDFEVPDLDGKKTRLSDFRGKVVLVNFWATWCPPCRKEIPSMQRAWKILEKENVMMLAVHIGGSLDKIWTFLTDYEVEFPVLFDARSKSTKGWPIVGLPTSFVVDPQGRIALRAIGGREWDDPELIKEILALRTKPSTINQTTVP